MWNKRRESEPAVRIVKIDRTMCGLYTRLHSRVGKPVSDSRVKEHAFRRSTHQLVVYQPRAVIVLVNRSVSKLDF